MISRSKRMIIAIAEDGVRRCINPFEGTPTAAVYDSILTMAGKTNREFPELKQCYPEAYASFVEQQFVGGSMGSSREDAQGSGAGRQGWDLILVSVNHSIDFREVKHLRLEL